MEKKRVGQIYLWLGVVGILALGGMIWELAWPQLARQPEGNAAPRAEGQMGQDLARLSHPAGTRLLRRIVERETANASGCPPWLLAAEARSFSGPREPIRAFYPEPYQVVFSYEMHPQGNEPFVILGHSLAEWGIGPNQVETSYIVYELIPSNCEQEHEAD